jgi:hypothetical protein
MNLTINAVELASELAEMYLEKHFEYSSILIYEEEDEGITYTEEAQDVFNDLYDKYYSLIDRLKINI